MNWFLYILFGIGAAMMLGFVILIVRLNIERRRQRKEDAGSTGTYWGDGSGPDGGDGGGGGE
ncbi:MAG: hypothetical protein AAF415_04275 [Pseudomonadota bacterium]